MEQTILTSTQQSVLSFLSKDKNFSKYFYFTGGTVLSAYYLHHRLSEDLDFFSVSEIDKLWITTMSSKLKHHLKAQQTDIQESFNRNMVYFAVGGDSLKTEFTYFPFLQIKRPIIINGNKVDSLLDIAVNKLFAIYQKPSSRHFIDLYLILKTEKIKWDELIKLARLKFDTYIDPLQLGTQLMVVDQLVDLPHMIIKLKNKDWQNYFFEKAKSLKKAVAK